MALPVTTRILILRDIKVLHLEPTDVCQAACPLCARETDVEFDKHKKHHLTPTQILQHVSEEQIKQLDKMFMCGIYGDPAAGKYTLELYEWFRKLNSNIVLGMNTNGAIQNTFWWHAVGKLFNQVRDYVVFSIDGLEDTNGVYRVGVSWTKLMANAEAFIRAGGSAHWDMLIFRHNQHQVDECEQLARDMGFKWFRAKVSKRSFTDRIQAPSGWKLPQVKQGHIECRALAEQSLYIDAQGRASPCCWLGGRQSNFVDDFEKIQLSWTTRPDPVCAKTCTSNGQGSSFINQWQREIELDV
jgi:sulfatase maturation enzyme AslB (radical SAM superfamily)